MPRFVVLIVGIVALAGLATWWLVSDNYVDEPKRPERAEPTQADRIIEFCTIPANRTNPLCSINPKDPEQVDEAVRDAVERRIIERQSDDDDDSSDTNIVIPRDNDDDPSLPSPTPSPEPAPPLVPIEIPEVPEVPVPELPLLP